MADWNNLTTSELTVLYKSLRNALSERGITATLIHLEPVGLPGRYRLFVVAPEFQRLDYSDRLSILQSCILTWSRVDQLRVTIPFPLSPEEVPTSDAAPSDAPPHAGPKKYRRRKHATVSRKNAPKAKRPGI